MRGSIILPEGAQIASLPAFYSFRERLETGIGSQLVLDGPASDTSPVGFELKAAKQFAGGGAVGGRRLGSQQLPEQFGGFGGPVRPMLATGDAWYPSIGASLRASAQITAVKFVETSAGETQFFGRFAGRELRRTIRGQ